jgi:hypothetical protein
MEPKRKQSFKNKRVPKLEFGNEEKELVTTIEKVSARLEAQESGGRLVDNR